ncbi:AraC family transcriptional regulator [Secundilactobacillus paracollinoides]|uniref:AraC family transcriptional regulator n=1 Tax=Secundilactobacillus paracollinoides TaxID=240427 RepID=UPI00081A7AE8|nr:AraC family transcriptional regulator [Secundilactobacillus paracollinoides]ANZ64977.1 AraC family transcriptional regulator [Secundilactobacillus paracollinoides]
MKVAVPKQFQAFMQTSNIDFPTILKQAGIANQLWREELDVSDQQYFQLLTALSDVLTNDQLVTLSDVNRINAFMPPFFAALCAPDGLAALKRLATYKKLAGPIKFDVQELGNQVQVEISFIYPQQELPRFSILNEQLLILSVLRTGSGQPLTPTLLAGPYAYGNIVETQFGLSGEQVAQGNQLAFDLVDLQRPFQTQNNVMWQYLEPEFNRQLAAMNSQQRFTNEVKKALFKAIPSGDFTGETVSQTLGVSQRTLQRNLSAENTTFKQQVQTVQKLLTINYLHDPTLTTTDIAYLVGYVEPSSFSRAFKKWTGDTLNAYRQKLSLKDEDPA